MSTDQKQRLQLWGLMIGPEIVLDFTLEPVILVLAIADIDDHVSSLMFWLEELDDVVDVVAVDWLDARGGEGHGDDAGGDVGQVEVEAVLLKAVLGAAADCAD